MRRIPSPTRRRIDERRRGAAIVEFAIIAPVFLVLILGTIEMGNALEATTQISSALREAGRLAGMDWNGVVPEGVTPNDKIITDIKNFLTAAGMPTDEMMIEITSADGDDQGQPFSLADPDNQLRLFKIEATIPYEQISSYPLGFMNGRDVGASIVMRSGRITLVQ